MQGFNGWTALLNALGISSTIDTRELSTTEPNGPNTCTATGTTTDTGYSSSRIMLLVVRLTASRMDSPTGATTTVLSPPNQRVTRRT